MVISDKRTNTSRSLNEVHEPLWIWAVKEYINLRVELIQKRFSGSSQNFSRIIGSLRRMEREYRQNGYEYLMIVPSEDFPGSELTKFDIYYNEYDMVGTKLDPILVGFKTLEEAKEAKSIIALMS